MSAEAVEEKVKTFVFQKKCGAPPQPQPPAPLAAPLNCFAPWFGSGAALQCFCAPA